MDNLLSVICDYITINYKYYPHNISHFIDKHSNHLATLLLMYPNEEWHWYFLSKMDIISWNFIKNNQHLKWDFSYIYIPEKHNDNIINDKDVFDLNIVEADKTGDITWEYIQNRPEIYWKSKYVSMNRTITLDTILQNLNYSWNIQGLLANLSISLLDILELIDFNWGWNWNDICFKRGHEVDIKILKQYNNIPWDMYNISQKANITIDDVKNNPNIQWDWRALQANDNIKNDPSIFPAKDYNMLSKNDNIQWEHISQNPNKPWDWRHISRKKSVSWNIIKSNPNYPWDNAGVSLNPNITWRIVRDNPDFPWDFPTLTVNRFNSYEKYFS